jgi:hypothetical protein
VNEFVYKLQHPFQFGDRKIEELNFAKPKAKHFKKMKISADGSIDIEVMLDVASRLCGELPAVIDELDPADMMGVVTHVGKSLDLGQPTGNLS